MPLSDWYILLGGDLLLDTKYSVHGSKSLSQTLGKGVTFIAHKDTFIDKPKNIRVQTWMTHENITPDGYNVWSHLFIGGVARVNDAKDTYFYWYLRLRYSADERLDDAWFYYGYCSGGTDNKLGGPNIYDQFASQFGRLWNYGKWRFVRVEGYEIGDKFNMSIAMTPDIDSPDPSNPTIDQLITVYSASADIPEELASGGGCGIAVGSLKESGPTAGRPFYDYTQIYY